jgi:hypothetical protein
MRKADQMSEGKELFETFIGLRHQPRFPTRQAPTVEPLPSNQQSLISQNK